MNESTQELVGRQAKRIEELEARCDALHALLTPQFALDHASAVYDIEHFKKTKRIKIGGDLVTEQILSSLKKDASYIRSSRFYEVLNATIANQSVDLALNKSKEWEHVLSGKMLRYYAVVFHRMLNDIDSA